MHSDCSMCTELNERDIGRTMTLETPTHCRPHYVKIYLCFCKFSDCPPSFSSFYFQLIQNRGFSIHSIAVINQLTLEIRRKTTVIALQLSGLAEQACLVILPILMLLLTGEMGRAWWSGGKHCHLASMNPSWGFCVQKCRCGFFSKYSSFSPQSGVHVDLWTPGCTRLSSLSFRPLQVFI